MKYESFSITQQKSFNRITSNASIRERLGEGARLAWGETELVPEKQHHLPPEILFITSYPPRECGIATYSQDLLKALHNKFAASFSLKVCALEVGDSNLDYPEEVKYKMDTSAPGQFNGIAEAINRDERIQFVVVQHEFGFFQGESEGAFLQFLQILNKPIVLVLHTVLPHPDTLLLQRVQALTENAAMLVTMTKNSANILHSHYGISSKNVAVIPHGTHLVPHSSKAFLKVKYGLTGRKVLSTFGLLSSGKSIETTLDAMPAIVATHPDALFLIIGKTHPGVVQEEGETYRAMLEAKIKDLNLQHHVVFINRYLPLNDLLEYLQLTDVYLFTSKDPNQAVSGTFSYAMSCGCPIVSTAIPHAREVLRPDTGILIDFQDSEQLAAGVTRLMEDEQLRTAFSTSTLQRIVPTSWENSAIAHARLLQRIGKRVAPGNAKIALDFQLPEIKLDHLKKMTTDFGMLQFSKINEPDLASGYTLDDNARALIALCMRYQLTREEADLHYIRIYLHFIGYCQIPGGRFLNYVDKDRCFTEQNQETNLADSNGRAIWALGFLISKGDLMPAEVVALAKKIFYQALLSVETVHATRSIAFTIKGLYFAHLANQDPDIAALIRVLANRMVQMYRHESEPEWRWFESYLTYGNSVLPEALLFAFRVTGDAVYKEIAQTSFDFLLSHTFDENRMVVISNKGWLKKGQKPSGYGEQPIDVAYTILALNEFGKEFKNAGYAHKMTIAFNWFLGNNHLHQIIYNPCTGGCFDGLEQYHTNLNQWAESTLSYLMARMVVEKHRTRQTILASPLV